MIVRSRVALVLASALLLLATSCSRDAATPAATPAAAPTGAVAQEKAVDVFEIELGDCLSGGNLGDTVSEMQKIDCAAPHVYEVYHLFNLPAGDFPGDEVVDQAADEGCTSAFAVFVGKTYDESELEMQTLTPQADGWKEHDDREVICLVLAAKEVPRTGSARGLNL